MKIKKIFNIKNRYLKAGIIFLATFLAVWIIFILFDRIIMPLATRHGKECVVPDVTLMSLEDAEQILKKSDLLVGMEGEEYSPTVPEGTILSQIPPAGRKVKKGRRIRVILSQGIEMTTIPNLWGVSTRQAEIMLSEVDLKLGEISYASTDSLPENVVIQTIPSFGARVPKGIFVGMVINQKGMPDTLIVPNFVGKNIEEVKELIQQMGLRIKEIAYRVDNNFLPGTVLEQYPYEGYKVPQGREIELVVSITE